MLQVVRLVGIKCTSNTAMLQTINDQMALFQQYRHSEYNISPRLITG